MKSLSLNLPKLSSACSELAVFSSFAALFCLSFPTAVVAGCLDSDAPVTHQLTMILPPQPEGLSLKLLVLKPLDSLSNLLFPVSLISRIFCCLYICHLCFTNKSSSFKLAVLRKLKPPPPKKKNVSKEICKND